MRPVKEPPPTPWAGCGRWLSIIKLACWRRPQRSGRWRRGRRRRAAALLTRSLRGVRGVRRSVLRDGHHALRAVTAGRGYLARVDLPGLGSDVTGAPGLVGHAGRGRSVGVRSGWGRPVRTRSRPAEQPGDLSCNVDVDVVQEADVADAEIDQLIVDVTYGQCASDPKATSNQQRPAENGARRGSLDQVPHRLLLSRQEAASGLRRAVLATGGSVGLPGSQRRPVLPAHGLTIRTELKPGCTECWEFPAYGARKAVAERMHTLGD